MKFLPKRVKGRGIKNLGIKWEKYSFGDKKWVTAIIIFAAILLLHGLSISGLSSSRSQGPFMKYPLSAKNYVEGKLPADRVPDFRPTYFYLHVAAQKLFSRPLAAVQWLQTVLLALSGTILFLLFRRFFSLWVSLLGTAAFAFHRSVIVYEQTFEPEPLLIFFLLGFLYFVLGNGKGAILLSGVFFAFGVLTRANFLPMLAVVPFYFWLHHRERKKWLPLSLLFILPVMVALSFLWIRNAAIRGEFSPYASNPGYVFFEGNNPNSTGKSAVYPPLVDDIIDDFPGRPDYHHEIYRLFARRITGRDLSVLEVNNFWTKKARDFIGDHPVHFLKLLAIKINFFFHDYRRHDLATAFDYDRRLGDKGIPTVPFWIVSALALIGMVADRANWKRDLVFYALFFIQFGILALTYVSARQRLAILSVFLLFALHGLCFAFKKWKNLLFLTVVLVFSYFTLGVENDLMKEENHQWEVYRASRRHWLAARLSRSRNRLEEAKRNAAYALALTPWKREDRRPAFLSFSPHTFARFALGLKGASRTDDFSSRFDRALLCIEARELKEAENILMKLIDEGHRLKRDFDHSSQPLFYLGLIEEMRRDRRKAILYFRGALENAPGSPFSLSHLYALTGEAAYREKLLRYFDRIDAEFFLGRAFYSIGRPDRAIPHFAYVVDRVPQYRKGLVYLAVSLGAVGRYDAAAGLYIRAIKKRIEPVFFEDEAVSIFKHWSRGRPGDVSARYYYGVVLHQTGRYRRALRALEEALKLSPPGSDEAAVITGEIAEVKKRIAVSGKRAGNPPDDRVDNR